MALTPFSSETQCSFFHFAMYDVVLFTSDNVVCSMDCLMVSQCGSHLRLMMKTHDANEGVYVTSMISVAMLCLRKCNRYEV